MNKMRAARCFKSLLFSNMISLRPQQNVTLWLLCIPTLVIGVLGSSTISAQSEANIPTAGQLQAAYKQNMLELGPMRVTWTLKKRITDFQNKVLEGELRAIEHSLKTDGITEAEKTELLRKQRLNAIVATKERDEPPLAADFWTDGTRFQMRVPHSTVDLSTFAFPDQHPTSDTLPTAYQKIGIISWSPGAKKYPSRRWGGKLGTVYVGEMGDSPNRIAPYEFPPLGRIREDWGSPSQWQEMDVFAAQPSDRLTVLGKEDVEGRSTYKVDATIPVDDDEVNKSNPSVKTERYIVAWLDAAQGFVPLKLISGKRYRHDRRILNDTHIAPDVITYVTKIDRIGDSFYPMSGRKEFYTTDTLQKISPPMPEDFIKGAQFEFPRVLTSIQTWEVSRVTADQAMDSALFEFDLPDGTRYFDSSAQRSMIVGVTEEEFDKRIAAKFPPRIAQPKDENVDESSRTLIYLNIAIVVVLIALVVSPRLLSRRAAE